MSGYRIVVRPMLVDTNGRPVGFLGADGQEYFLPRFDPGMQSLIRPDGTALSGTGSGYVLPPATTTTLGGVKAGTGLSVAADGTLNALGGAGTTLQTVSDDTLPAMSMVYIKPSGNCALADATAEGKEAIGYVTAAVSSGQQATISFTGTIASGFSGLVPGTPYYLGTTPGTVVPANSAPSTTGNVLQRIGTALSSSSILFAPEAPITL